MLVATVLAAPPPRPAEAAPPDPGATGRAASARRTATAVDQPATQARGTAALSPVGTDDGAARALAQAAFDGGYADASFVRVPPLGGTHAVVSALGAYPPSGSSAALLTTGDATLADDPDDYHSSGRDSGGGVYRGDHTYDVTVLRVVFDVPSGNNCLNLRFRFYSEEYPEFATGTYNDAFLAELDSSTWDTAGTTINAPNNFVRSRSGGPIGSAAAGQLGMNRSNATGTTYDAATPTLEATTPVTPGRHSVFLSVFDQYDAVYDSAVAIDRVSSSQRQDCPVGIGSRDRPIIFVPGILGSQLDDGNGKEQWPAVSKLLTSRSDDHLDRIKLKADGITDECNCNIHPTKVIEKILVKDIYKNGLKYLQDAGYVLDKDGRPSAGETLFPHPVDWRLSAAQNAGGLLTHIEAVLQATGADKVNIIAHSQGGLVTIAMLSLNASVGKVNRVATLGTPFLGAAKALGVLRYQKPCMIPAAFFCLVNEAKLQEVGTNMPGMLNLLPSQLYWGQVGVPLVTKRPFRDESGNEYTVEHKLTFGEVRDKLSGFNLPLIDQSTAWHNANDVFTPRDPNLAMVRIVGSGNATIHQIAEVHRRGCLPPEMGGGCTETDNVEFSEPKTGDGTVPEGSARGSGDTRFYRVINVNPRDHGDVSHVALPGNKKVLAMALDIVRVDGPLSTSAGPGAGIAEATGAAMPPGVSEEPAALAGTELTTWGPIGGLLTDADGRRTGLTELTERRPVTDIPGSSFDDSGTYSRSFLIEGGAAGRWTATATGEVGFRLRAFTDGAAATAVAYPPVAVRQGAVLTLAQVSAPLPATAPALGIDDDGDGDVDRTVAPRPPVAGAAAGDDTPPTTSSAVALAAGRARITVTAADETGGSGVDRIEWLQTSPGDNRFRPYTGVLDVPAGGTVYIRAVDRAGNADPSYYGINLGG
ncbi:alpha/beta fold hydrolase [Actinoplanes sp. NPDC026619]|uniref:alpha/beta fold hydrolase n=1 Tax=Actinoplanes sp. NPDC026619 TaxID=3155798 RepID=UPI0033E5EA5C